MFSPKVLSRIIAAACLAAVLGAAGAAYAYVIPLVELPICTAPTHQTYPAISGTKVVYCDGRNGNSDIYLFDLTTHTETLLTGAGRQEVPDISGQRVVYMDWRAGQSEIYSYDLTTNTESRLTSATGSSEYPRISGNRVVWGDSRNGSKDIYLYDFTAHEESRLTSDTSSQASPAISGDKVVYEDDRNGNLDIYCYDLTTNTERRLTTNTSVQSSPDISGDKVVYEDNRNGESDIYCYDLTTSIESRLTSDTANQSSPRISGTKVTYNDFRNGSWDIYLYDLATGVETRLTTSSGIEQSPVISGDRVVWMDMRTGNFDIYLGELATPRITGSAPGTVGYGAKCTVAGALSSVTGIPLAGREVWLEVSVDGASWTGSVAAVTDAAGTFTFAVPALFSARYARANFRGQGPGGYLSAQSAPVLVKPRASLGTPVAPASMSHTKTYTVYGGLKPRHTAGTIGGTLQCYRLEKGKWKLRKSFALSAYDYSTDSRVRASVKLTSAGKWRMRILHADASHAATYSAWRNVTVK